MIRSAKTNVVLTSAVAGSQVITVTPLTSTGTPGTAVTKTITWTAAGTLDVSASKSTSVISAYISNVAALSFIADAVVSVPAGTTPAQKAAIKVTLLDSNGIAVNGKALTATVSGPGLLSVVDADETQTGTLARAVTTTLTSDNVGYVTVSNDGSAGTSVVTISVGTTIIATETLTFSGLATKFEIKAVSGVYGIAAIGSQDSATTGISVKATDSAGNVVDGKNVFLTSSDVAIATVSAAARATGANASDPDGFAYFILTGVNDKRAKILMIRCEGYVMRKLVKPTLEIIK
jgi:hypothetical protein